MTALIDQDESSRSQVLTMKHRVWAVSPSARTWLQEADPSSGRPSNTADHSIRTPKEAAPVDEERAVALA